MSTGKKLFHTGAGTSAAEQMADLQFRGLRRGSAAAGRSWLNRLAMSDSWHFGSDMSGMRNDNRNGHVAQGSLAAGHPDPCVCAAHFDLFIVDDDRCGSAGLTFEDYVAGRRAAGKKNRYHSNPAAKHAGLLAAANFRFYMRGEKR